MRPRSISQYHLDSGQSRYWRPINSEETVQGNSNNQRPNDPRAPVADVRDSAWSGDEPMQNNWEEYGEIYGTRTWATKTKKKQEYDCNKAWTRKKQEHGENRMETGYQDRTEYCWINYSRQVLSDRVHFPLSQPHGLVTLQVDLFALLLRHDHSLRWWKPFNGNTRV